jgi:hypothetical protein
LGIPEVRLGSRQLAFRTLKVLALLVYLALEPGFHSRDELIALLWPDADQSKGRGNLRMASVRLRHDLHEALGSADLPNWVRAELARIVPGSGNSLWVECPRNFFDYRIHSNFTRSV